MQATRIPARYLHALEEDAPLDAFPAPVYARFFLREYAQFLGVDPAPLVEMFDARHGVEVEEPPLLEPVPELVRVPLLPSRSSRVAAAAAVVAALIAAVFGITSGGEHASEAPSAPLQVAHIIRPGRPATMEREQVPPTGTSGVRAVLRIRERCWVLATVDGRTVLSETLEPGQTKRFRADRRLELHLGHAGGVVLTVNGKPVSFAGQGDVAQLSFAWRHGHLVTG